MSFIGEVNVSLYWGTLYDTINVPLHSQQIVNDATKTMDLTGYIVWQTTYLTQLRINIDNYQDIVGVQYCRIVDKGTPSQGAHWYEVLDYQQVSQGCVELGLRYDTLLTIPLSTWKTCSGTLRRWSVDNDTPYGFLNSTEPVDLVEPLEITWHIVQPIVVQSVLKIAGFPYDMTSPPEVITYTNPNGETTNVYYPKLNSPGNKITKFQSGLTVETPGAQAFFDDGLQYNYWVTSQAAYDTYNKAVSLGIDIVVNGYLLPSGWAEIDHPDNGYLITIKGKRQTYTTPFAMYLTGVNNAKAGSINTTFTLASASSGDSVVVNNYQLADGSVVVYSDPYSTGGMRARFLHYLNELIGTVGWVKSPAWQPLTITSGVGFGTVSDMISNTMSADTLQLSTQQARDSASFALDQMSSKYAHDMASDAISGGVSVLSAALSGNISGAITAGVNTVSQLGTTTFDYNQQREALTFRAQQADASAAQQAEMLRYAGNAGRLAPPSVKYAMAKEITGLTYAFTVMCARPSARDIKRLDNFFTAYGYNVDGTMLTSPNQLHTRERFTFVQADDVRVLSTIYSNNNERIGDSQTISDIQRRFAAGLRIWRETPNYDYSLANPIMGGT